MAEHAAVASAISTIGRNRVGVGDSDVMSKTRSRSTDTTNRPMKLLHFNISGQRFILSDQLIRKFPDSKLNNMSMLEKHWVAELGVYYFDRDPVLFNTVLNVYRYGVLSIPPGYDRNLVKKEAEFWNVPCESLLTARDQAEAKLEAEFKWLENRIPPPPQNAKPWLKARYKAWCFITDPLGPYTPFRKLSIICCFMTVALTLIYMVLFGLSTSAYYREPIKDRLRDVSKPNGTDIDVLGATAAIGCTSVSKLDCYLRSRALPWINILSKVIMIIFIIETALRLLFCPGCAYFKSVVTWMDIFAGVCAIIVFALEDVLKEMDDRLDDENKKSLHFAVIMMQSSQVLRIFKIFQVGLPLIQ